jgi:hypothetical protein
MVRALGPIGFSALSSAEPRLARARSQRGVSPPHPNVFKSDAAGADRKVAMTTARASSSCMATTTRSSATMPQRSVRSKGWRLNWHRQVWQRPPLLDRFHLTTRAVCRNKSTAQSEILGSCSPASPGSLAAPYGLSAPPVAPRANVRHRPVTSVMAGSGAARAEVAGGGVPDGDIQRREPR